MHTQRILVATAAGIGGACIFLPWASVPLFGSIDGTELNEGRAWTTLALCVGVIACAFLGNLSDPLAAWATLPCVLLGAAITGSALWAILELHAATEEDPFGIISIEFAPFVLAAAGFAITLLSARANHRARR